MLALQPESVSRVYSDMPAAATKLVQFLVAELCVLLVGSCRSAPTTDTGGSEVTVDRRAPATAFCPRGVVEVAGFRKPSRATGEWSVIAVLANGSSAPCGVRGAPKVQFRDAEGEPMSFEYAVNGGMYVRRTDSARITLDPGGRAYVKVAKYRCDLGVATRAETISIVALGVDATARLPRWASLATCHADEPQGRLEISTLVDSFDAAGG